MITKLLAVKNKITHNSVQYEYLYLKLLKDQRSTLSGN